MSRRIGMAVCLCVCWGCVGPASVEGARVATFEEELVTAGVEVGAHAAPAHSYEVERGEETRARTWPEQAIAVSYFGRYRKGLGRGLEARAGLRAPSVSPGVAGIGAELGLKWRALGYVPGDGRGGTFALSFAVDAGALATQIFGEEGRSQLYLLGHAHGRAWASVTLGDFELYAAPVVRWERLWDRFDEAGEVTSVTSDAWSGGGGLGAVLDVDDRAGARWALEVGGLAGQGASVYVGVGVTR